MNRKSIGTQHFIAQRLTALVNLLIGIPAFVIFLRVYDEGYPTIKNLLSQEIIWIPMVIYILSLTYHMKIGVGHMLNDYFDGGEVLDVDPQLSAADAVPDRSVDRLIRERGWVEDKELERLTGKKVSPDIGKWIVDPEVLQETLKRIRYEVESAGPVGLDLSLLDERDRAAVELLDDLQPASGRLISPEFSHQLSDHPFVKQLIEFPFTPPDPKEVDRAELRELVRRGEVIEHDGIFFAPIAVEKASELVAELLKSNPEGFTVSTFRESAGNTRKHALPLLGHLDETGITRRRGDVRIAGPRLPSI